jgi:pimeloyl-ACP methyl ester carboxylesterase
MSGKMMSARRIIASCWVGVLMWGTASEAGREPAPDVLAPRRVYVLHSGVHVILSKAGKNGAAERLRQQLLRRGIAERDVIVLENPFPAASWSDVLPRESILMFLESANPASAMAHAAYVRLDRALREKGVSERDELIWVGHSAGGQIGMTLAHLAHRLPRYPELARQARRYRFGMVVTLGTPVAVNRVPPEVALRHYYSAADTVVGLLSRHGALLTAPLGTGVQFGPCREAGANVRVRIFQGIRHHSWCSTAAVIDCLLAEPRDRNRAAWAFGPALGALLTHALEQESQISFEDEEGL